MARNSNRFKSWACVAVLLPLFVSVSAPAQTQSWTPICDGDVCPAFWMLGAQISPLNSASCGETDVRGHIGPAAATSQSRVTPNSTRSTSSRLACNIDRSQDSGVASRSKSQPHSAVLAQINQALIVSVNDNAKVDGIEVEEIADSLQTMNTPLSFVSHPVCATKPSLSRMVRDQL